MTSEKPIASTLTELPSLEAQCTRCPLYRDATQVVPGEGPANARIMFVGEQPGDKEDLAGHPFVGPAGKMFDKALEEAGIARDTVFVTNAVKHFKHELRGKKRLHRRPDAFEIDRCKWWLEQESALVKPAALVALGATAVRSLMQRAATISALRGRPQQTPDGTLLFVTIHPSYLLRIRDSDDRTREFAAFVDDLAAVRKEVSRRG
jgi:DNA polymerase